MKKNHIVTLLACCVAMVIAQEQQGVNGIVETSKGKSLDGVVMTCYSLDKTNFLMNVTTDAKGVFDITEPLPSGSYALLAKDGYHPVVYVFREKAKHSIQMFDLNEAEGMGLISKDKTALATGHYHIARAHFENDRFDKALAAADQSMGLEVLAPVLKLASFCSYKLEQWEKAIELGNAYLKENPEDQNIANLVKESENQKTGVDPVKVYNQAIAAINADDDETAAQLLSQVIAKDKKFALAYFDLGQIAIREGDFETGIGHLKTFVKLASKKKHKQEIADAKDLISSLDE